MARTTLIYNTLLGQKDTSNRQIEVLFLQARNQSLAKYNSPHREMSVWRPDVLVNRGNAR